LGRSKREKIDWEFMEKDLGRYKNHEDWRVMARKNVKIEF
jgi:hypothetical protein